MHIIHEPAATAERLIRYSTTLFCSSPNSLIAACPSQLVVNISALFLNGVIIVTFVKNRHLLLNDFTVHILSLTVINWTTGFMLVFFVTPCHALNQTSLRNRMNCAAYRGLTFLIAYMILHIHFVICLDRWMALLAPICLELFSETDRSGSNMGYRQHRKVSLAVAVSDSGEVEHRKRQRSWPSQKARNTMIFACLTLAQIILWVPNTIIALCRLQNAPFYKEDLRNVFGLLSCWLLLVDSLIYLTFLPNLRSETVKTLRLCICNC
ncbi:hypothetical protein BV898_00108 [Hypsibius exemplaris]|uniref:G-protein coupled receptors family 1 profile domain-containing protein n=1 Tax=Hypsibius exemplaris TaxID=2072580 RepID=A0A1W0XEQ6_HYPEX|nr:hypothetical protein BV898_00108 [Hypsibius exemplaris]